MAEAEYIRPTVDPLSGVQEGLNIFERIQRIRQVEQEGKRAAEQHLTNKLLDSTEIQIRNMKISEAEDARIRRATAVNAWSTGRGEFDTTLSKALEDLKDDPIARQTALAGLKARYTSVSTYHPEAGAYIETSLAPHLANADLQFAEKVKNADVDARSTEAEIKAEFPGYRAKQIFNPVTQQPFWVKTKELDMTVVGPVLGDVMDAETPEQLKSALKSKEAAQLRFLPEVQQAYSNKLAELQLAAKKAADDEKDALEIEQKQINVEKTKGEVAAQKSSKVGKQQEAKELALEARTTINEIRFFRSKSESGKANVANAVGAIQGSKPARFFNRLFNGDREDDQRRLLKLVQMDILSLTKFLRPISEGELDFLRQSVPDINSSDETWMGYLGRKQKVMEAALANMEDPNFDPDRDSLAAGGRSPGLAPAADGSFSADQLEAAARGQ